MDIRVRQMRPCIIKKWKGFYMALINKKYMALCALIVLAQPVKMRADEDPNRALKTFVAGSLIVGGAVAGAVGLNYLMRPSNEALMQNAQDLVIENQSLVRDIDTYTSDEADLSRFAQNYLHNSSVSRSGVENKLDKTRSMRKNLMSRRSELNRSTDAGNADYEAMGRQIDTLTDLEAGLQRVNTYMSNHSGYFEWYAYNNKMRGRYGDVLLVLNDVVAIRNCAANHGYDLYPIVAYVERLDKDIKELEVLLARHAHMHPTGQQMSLLYDQLKVIRAALAYDYSQEKQKRAEARRQEESNRVARDLVEARMREARALEEQTRALERRNELDARRDSTNHSSCRNDYCNCGRRAECPAVKGYHHRFCTKNHCCCRRPAECPFNASPSPSYH